MNKKSSSYFGKIKSKYVYQILFSYMKDKTYKLNLFKYSKSFQTKLGINKLDYEKEYLSNQEINYKLYFSFKNNFRKVEDKNILKKMLNDDLQILNIDFNLIEEYAIKSYKNKKNEEQIKIDIYSPFFESLFKKDFSKKNYEIIIPIDIIENFELKNDYISAIEKLNKLESNMNRVCINFKYKNPSNINYLMYLNLNFKLIKKLKLRQKKKLENEEKGNEIVNKDEKMKESNFLESKSYDNFYKILFTLPDIQNILVDLDLKNSTEKNIPNSFELINKLKVLKNLTLTGYLFPNIFILKLYDLERINLTKVNNLSFDKNIPFNLNYLYIFSCKMGKSKALIKIFKKSNNEF